MLTYVEPKYTQIEHKEQIVNSEEYVKVKVAEEVRKPEDAFVEEEADDIGNLNADDFHDNELYRRVKKNLEGIKFFQDEQQLESASRIVSKVWKKFMYYAEDMKNVTVRARYYAMRPDDQKKDVVFNSAFRYLVDLVDVENENLFIFEAWLFAAWLALMAFLPKQYTIMIGLFILISGASILYLPVMLAGLKVAYLLLSKAMCQKSKEYVQTSVPYPGMNLFWVMSLAIVGAIPFGLKLVPGSWILTIVTIVIMTILLTHLPAIASKSAVSNIFVVAIAIVILAFAALVSTLKPRYLWTRYQYPFAESDELYLLAEKYHEQAALFNLNALWRQLNNTIARTTTVVVEDVIDSDNWFYTEKNYIFSYITETFMFGILLASCGLNPALMKCISEKIASLSSKSKDAPVRHVKDCEVGYTAWVSLITRNIFLLFAEAVLRWIWWKGTFVAILLGALTTAGAIMLSHVILKIIAAPLVDTAANAAVAGKGLADGNATFGIYSIGTIVNGKMQNSMYIVMAMCLLVNLLVALATRTQTISTITTFALVVHVAMIMSNAPVRLKQSVALLTLACGSMSPISAVHLMYQIVIRKSKDFDTFINPLPPEVSGTPIVYQL